MTLLRLAVLLFAIISLFSPDTVNAQSANVSVSVTGSGSTLDEAKSDAIRQALQVTLKQLVVVDRAISGDQVLRDRVLSTMNGYIEKIEITNVRKRESSVRVDASIVVSASRIENFIGVAVAPSGSFDSSGILVEANRRKAQIEAEKLQAKARGEILDRLFVGFPSEAMEVRAVETRLSKRDPNLLHIKLEHSLKPSFVTALERTVQALAQVKCRAAETSISLSELADRFVDQHECLALPETAVYKGPVKAQDVVCFGYTDHIQCYGLAPGNYCTSCQMKHFLGTNSKSLIVFLSFLDANRQPVATCSPRLALPIVRGRGEEFERKQNHVFVARANWMYSARINHPGYDRPRSNHMIAGFDLRKSTSFVEVDLRSVDLSSATQIIALPALSAHELSIRQRDYEGRGQPWVTSLVPDVITKSGCDLLREAEQRQVDPSSAGDAAKRAERMQPLAR